MILLTVLVLATSAPAALAGGLTGRLESCLGGESVSGLMTGAVPLNSTALPLPRASIDGVLAGLSAPRREELTRMIEAMRARGVGDENIEKFLGLFSRGCSVR